MARDRWNLSARSKVVEVASNDGYLLKHFVAASIPVLGVEPAANVAVEAINAGVPTEIAFFGTETAQRLKEQGHSADLLIGNNVFAHVPDINDFAGGLAILLKPDGVISLEFPHLLKLIQQTQFDTIYHEHYSYMSLLAAENIFRAQGLRIFDVEELPTHGGSLRIFACHEANSKIATGSGVESVRRDESAAQFDRDAGYAGFEPKVHAVRAQLREFLKNAKAQNKSVVGYGAAAKGNTLLNYCQIKAEDELIDYVVDLNPHKQDTLLPGSHIEVFSPSKIGETKPDYVLILPWNLRDEIIKQLDFVRQWGCEFVVAIPELTILP
jgi:SAM-dependent methyltransferase